ncbi:MAG: primosomal protein N' [Pseudazoarcus pumilus]|nr:primosomal protein N' [Pseudazoarcus pumilus]
MSSPEPLVARVAIAVPLPQLFDYSCENLSIDDIGRCVRVPFGSAEKNGVIVEVLPSHTVDASRLKSVSRVLRELPPLPADWLALAAFVARYYHEPLGEVIALALPPGLRRSDTVDSAAADPFLAVSAAGRAALESARDSRARQLVAALCEGGVQRRSVLREHPLAAALNDAMRRGWIEIAAADRPPHTVLQAPRPTPDQQAAIDAVAASLESFQCWLLQGVTGSGKTEVYLRLAERVLAAGRQVLMLVPEIALTPQLESRVASRFPFASVVSLHSAQAAGARSRGFVQAMEGHADIVLGTRLSVFTPMPRLGLILLDEEHDASYKQQEGVRYSARDVAVWRAHERGVPIVLGSATPSLESWQHARQGRYRPLRLDARAVSAAMPGVRCVDTRHIRLDEGLSPALREAIGQRLQRGEQSLVFLNRRGYAPVLSCTACGWVSGCPHCSAKLVVHLADRRMRCHHCGTEAPIPPHCPSCGNQDIQPFGRGTQRIEERLTAMFPQARVLRVDRDAARTRPQWEALLARIAAGEADILVGTQMMAKGHDFPKLTLVGVIGADSSLHAADFRAPERLFQQLMQVGGRAGRAHLAGEVLIQTEFPEHPLYRHLARHDFDGFAARELDERRLAGFPPFSHQTMLRADAPELELALGFLAEARECALAIAPEGLRVFDAVPMRMTRLARRERAQLLVEADQRGLLQAFVAQWLEHLRSLRAPRTLRWQIDIDPLEV